MDSKVGCEREDGLLNVHPVEATCEVCAPASVEGEVPKVKPRCSTLDCDRVATKTGHCRKHSAEREVEAESKRGFWTAARIYEILEKYDQATTLPSGKVVRNTFLIYRFVQRMFERQTMDEQANFSTSHDNGIGFAGCDARLLSDMATGSKKFNDEYQQKYGRMNTDGFTVRQAKYAASRLKKYVKTQLVEIANEATSVPMPEAVTPQSVEAALRRAPEPSLQQKIAEQYPLGAPVSVEAKIAELKSSNPEKYYDPFEEGERLSEEAALAFWTKRFSA